MLTGCAGNGASTVAGPLQGFYSGTLGTNPLDMGIVVPPPPRGGTSVNGSWAVTTNAGVLVGTFSGSWSGQTLTFSGNIGTESVSGTLTLQGTSPNFTGFTGTINGTSLGTAINVSRRGDNDVQNLSFSSFYDGTFTSNVAGATSGQVSIGNVFVDSSGLFTADFFATGQGGGFSGTVSGIVVQTGNTYKIISGLGGSSFASGNWQATLSVDSNMNVTRMQGPWSGTSEFGNANGTFDVTPTLTK